MMTGQQLKNSILQMAVQGKLVPQDPNDEPASVLLERIRKEKERLVREKRIKPEKNPSVIFRGADNLPYEKRGKVIRCIADEVPFEIPDSWEWVRLGEITYNHGQTKPDFDFCYIDIGSIDNMDQCLNKKETILQADEAPSRARKIVWYDDILYATVRPYLHNMCIVNRKFSHPPIASTGFAVLACLQGIKTEYLFRYMMSPDFDQYANNNENSKGVAYPAINDKKLMNALVPVPPYSEQIRILKKLEKIMPHVTEYNEKQKAISSLNTSLPSLLKKSILQEAIQGRLVPQDPNDEPASVLLERIRKEKARLIKEGKLKPDKHESVIFRRDNSHYEKLDGKERCIDDEIPFEIPDNWAWVRLKQVSSKITDGEHKTPKKVDCFCGFFLLSARNILDTGIQLEPVDYVDKEEYHRISQRCNPRRGDILMSCSGSIGRCCKVNDDNNYVMVRSAAMISPLIVDVDYLILTLQSSCIQSQVESKKKQTAQANLFQEAIRNLLIPLPPLWEQRRIYRKLEQLFAYISERSKRSVAD